MQRSKLQVGEHYALATWRDWAEYTGHTQQVQVIDVDPWYMVAYYNAQQDPSEPDRVTFQDGDQVTVVDVPKRYRRRQPNQFARGKGNLVMVRQWLPGANGNTGAWGEPKAVETRTLVATWADAQVQVAAKQAEKDEKSRAAAAEKSRRDRRQDRVNERLRHLNLGIDVRLERSRFSDRDIATVNADVIEALLTLAERGFEGAREFEPEGL